MIIKILIGIAVVVALFAIVVAMQPSAFRIARTVKISAPAAAIFPHVNNMRKWQAWSPWEKVDPALERTYEGPAEGTGAVYSFAGNKEVGAGRSTIVESRPGELVKLKLEFFKPFVATNDVEFTFKPEGEQTSVTWAMAGEKNFMFKAVGLFMSMDKMCGDQFAKGLADLKSVVEAVPALAQLTK